jgi:hypothetical protein
LGQSMTGQPGRNIPYRLALRRCGRWPAAEREGKFKVSPPLLRA